MIIVEYPKNIYFACIIFHHLRWFRFSRATFLFYLFVFSLSFFLCCWWSLDWHSPHRTREHSNWWSDIVHSDCSIHTHTQHTHSQTLTREFDSKVIDIEELESIIALVIQRLVTSNHFLKQSTAKPFHHNHTTSTTSILTRLVGRSNLVITFCGRNQIDNYSIQFAPSI